jgi:hypothetical protein
MCLEASISLNKKKKASTSSQEYMERKEMYNLAFLLIYYLIKIEPTPNFVKKYFKLIFLYILEVR